MAQGKKPRMKKLKKRVKELKQNAGRDRESLD
jgi:hypothetical protein